MKKAIWALIAAILVVGVVAGSSSGIAGAAPDSKSNPAPAVTVVNSVNKLERKVSIVIIGSGFAPGQEARLLLLEPKFGTTTDLDWSLDPVPVANDSGAWITTWNSDRYVQRGLLAEGVYSITVTDNDYNSLATTAVAFWDVEKAPEEWPSWAKGYLGD
jgi:hypothetical protein